MTTAFEKLEHLIRTANLPDGESLPKGASEETILQFENRMSIIIPDDFKRILRITNGPLIGPNGFYGIETARKEIDIEYLYYLFPCWRTLGWIPVCGDGCGNYYLIVTTGRYGAGYPVVFVDTTDGEDAPSFIVSSGVIQFGVFILEDEIENDLDNYDTPWPFDEAYVITHDPEIMNFHGVPLPWQA